MRRNAGLICQVFVVCCRYVDAFCRFAVLRRLLCAGGGVRRVSRAECLVCGCG